MLAICYFIVHLTFSQSTMILPVRLFLLDMPEFDSVLI